MSRTAGGAGATLARAISGLLAAAVTLGVGSLVALGVDPDSSPFFAVGSAVVDRTPTSVREWAIGNFGSNDKLALFVGMAVVIAVIAAAAGIAERRRRPIGSALFVVFGAVGVAAAVSRPGADGWWAVPTVVGVLFGIVVLRGLTARTRPEAESGTAAPAGCSRRSFLGFAGTATAVAAATLAAGQYLGQKVRSVAADRAKFIVPKPASPAKPIAPGVTLPVDGITPFVTRNGDFYRVDTALQLPAVTTDEWRLRIHGMTERELELTFDDLRRRSAVARVITLTCVSNVVGGNLVGNATWTGYRLSDLLRDAGVHADADMLLSRSVDGFTAGTPLETVLDGRDALLAVAMNGEPLPVEHGYPARLIVPGLYGYVSATKWVTDLEVTRFDRATAYWTDRGWAPRGPIKTASRIDVPGPFASVPAGRVTVAGVAWAQHRGVRAVELRVDGGRWQRATLADAYSKDTWRQWRWEWEAAAGGHTLEVRAIDGDGQVQTEQRMPPYPSGSTGWQSRSVTVT